MNKPYFVIALSEIFENMMNLAETKFSKKYDDYTDFEEDFYHNLKSWESFYVSSIWSTFIQESKIKLGKNIFQNIELEGRFYEQIDYKFHFVYKISGDNDTLEIVIEKLHEWNNQEKEDFDIFIQDIDNYFSPSYSGDNKQEIWSSLNVSGIYWPPRIINN